MDTPWPIVTDPCADVKRELPNLPLMPAPLPGFGQVDHLWICLI
jgi:hypothetical protein